MFRFLAVTGVLIGFLAYQMYEPLPSHVQDKAMVTFIHTVSYSLEKLGRIVEYLGLTTTERMRQRAISVIVPSMSNTSVVHVAQTKFAQSRTIVAWRPDSESGNRPGLIYIHGGGWAFGGPEFNGKLISELVERTGVTIFAISYRLSTHQRFPGAFEDCLAATRAILDSASDHGVNTDRIGVAGDSAGGQLAASVVQALHRSDGDKHRRLKLQVLIYPVTQAVNLRTESYLSQVSEPVLKPQQMASFISLYLTGSTAASDWLASHGHVTAELQAAYKKATGQALPSKLTKDASPDDAELAAKVAAVASDYRVSPLLGDGLEQLGLPPAHILACEFDPLLDDSLLYAERLQRSGVRIHLRRFPTFHGSSGFPNDGREIRDHLVQILGSQL